MARIPVTLADFVDGRIKSSVSKLRKHHPDQPFKPKLSLVQQTFAQILGYGGFEDLRSQAKQNGAIYSGESLAIEQFIASISRRISRYWSVSVEKAECVAADLGLMHLDAFRPTARPVQQLALREDSVSPPWHSPNIGVSTSPFFDAVRQATVTLMPVAQMEALKSSMKPMAQMAAILEAMKPTAHMAQIGATLEAMKPSAQMVQMAAILEAMKPTAHMAQIGATLEAMKP
ncbi:hypothetical protein, partial [Pseudomonas poae]|uniref:hypothetical protein n=1 Tax=Pseudomonas poae TaxID=200451 RepID=UPI0034D432EB